MTPPKPNRIVFLWCVPRSLSTAFEKMMACSNLFDVLGEPFIDVYKSALRSEEDFRLAKESFHQIASQFIERSEKRPIFVKDMAYHAEPFISDELILSARHTFLIRDPRLSIPSLYKMRPTFTEDQPGFKGLVKLFHKIQTLTGIPPSRY